MRFRDYFYALDFAARAAFAGRCGTSVGYLSLVISGHRAAGETLALRIERESAGAVRVEELRPDVPWEVVRGTGAMGPPSPACPACRTVPEGDAEATGFRFAAARSADPFIPAITCLIAVDNKQTLSISPAVAV